MRRAVVVGGGISGLAAARVLAGGVPVSNAGDAGVSGEPMEVVLLEAAPRLGGKVLTGSVAGVAVELGPDQFLLRDPSAERLCRHLGLGDCLVEPAVRSAAVFARGQRRQLPGGLALGIPTDAEALRSSGIVSEEAVERLRAAGGRAGGGAAGGGAGGGALAAADLGLDGGDDPSLERSAGAVLRPIFGDEIVDRLVDPLLGGINAGGVDTLSLGTAAPQIARALAGVGECDIAAALTALRRLVPPPPSPPSPFRALAGGLGRLVTAVEAELASLGCKVSVAMPALAVRRQPGGAGYTIVTRSGEIAADLVVIASPAQAAARLLGEVAPGAASELSVVAYASVAVMTLVLDGALPAEVAGWSGVLVPRGEGALATAVSFLTQKWPWIGKATVVRVSAGRFGDDRIAGMSDADLTAQLKTEMATYAATDLPALGDHLERWVESFPQYQPGHAARIRRVQAGLAEAPGVSLAGALLGGIGVPACITSGEAAAGTSAAGTSAAGTSGE